MGLIYENLQKYPQFFIMVQIPICWFDGLKVGIFGFFWGVSYDNLIIIIVPSFPENPNTDKIKAFSRMM